MERAHVLVRLGGGAGASEDPPGICRTSTTTVRVEHSYMSPGVASISFEHVSDAEEHSPALLFRQGLAAGVDAVVRGQAMTLVLTGAPGAGKSLSCHGSRQRSEPGLATLAIRHVFSQLEARGDGAEFQVLLTCLCVREDGEIADCLGADDEPPATMNDRGDDWRGAMDAWLVRRSVRVGSSAEAVHQYSRSREQSGGRDFVLALHVEARTGDGRVTRGRFLCIDVHGSGIIEPAATIDAPEAASPSKKPAQPPYFEDTHFPVNRTLSEAFGGFLGNESATYIVVVIRKAAQYQQQAIQSLLFACKAKDIRSACRISYLSSFTSASGASTSNIRSSSSNNTSGMEGDLTDHDTSEETLTLDPDSQSQDYRLSLRLDIPTSPVPPLSENNQADSLTFSTRPSTPRSPAPSTRSTADHADLLLRKRLAVSDRLRKAYEVAKAASVVLDPPSSGGIATAEAALLTRETAQDGNETDSSDRGVGLSRTQALHQLADTILEASEWRPASLPKGDMSLLQKLELIRLKHDELERALAHTVAVKDKCVDRISKLTQTMGLQATEHEKNLTSALASKQTAEAKLRDMQAKFTGVAGEITALQQQVAAMKTVATSAVTSPSETAASDLPERSLSDVSTLPPAVVSCSCKSEERAMLQGFASKLETAMQDAKSVVTFKDGVIRDLEVRLRDAERRAVESSARFEREKLQLSSDNASLADSLDQLRAQLLASDERVRDETFRTQQDQADLMVKMAQLTLDMETQRKQWAEREQELEARASKAVADEQCAREALAVLREGNARVHEGLTASRRKLVALHAAHTAVMASNEQLEAELSRQQREVEFQSVVRKLAKRKAKLDRARTLLSDRKQQIANANTQIDQLRQQVEAAVKERRDAQREATSLRRQLSAKASEVEGLDSMKRVLEDAVQTLKEQLSEQQEDQEQFASQAERIEEAAEQAAVDALEEQKRELTQEFQRQLYELEQSFGRRIVTREAQLQRDHDAHVRELMKRHSAELLQLQHDKRLGSPCSDQGSPLAAQDKPGDIPESREERRERHRESLERQLSTTRTASLSSASSCRSSSSAVSRSSSPSPAKPTPTTPTIPTTPPPQSIRDLDALIVEKERRYDEHAAIPRRTPSKSSDKQADGSPGKLDASEATRQYKKALGKKQREVDELRRRTQQLLNALATANEEETIAKTRAEQAARAQEQAAARLDALLAEMNRVKQENWGLSLALQVTERARPWPSRR